MSFLSVFKNEPVNLENMTPEQRVKYFAKQKEQEAKIATKTRRFINGIISLATTFFGDEVTAIVNKWRPVVEAIIQNPEQLMEVLAENIEALSKSAGIKSHHIEFSFSKPAGIRDCEGFVVANKDVRGLIRIYNPHLKQYFEFNWDLRAMLRAQHTGEKFDLWTNIEAAYNQGKPVDVSVSDQSNSPALNG